MDNEELPELIHSFITTNGTREDLWKKKINESVLNLLMNNISYLYQVLYRIDVKEEKVKAAFSDNPEIEVVANRITSLIVERQIEKLKWRQKYNPEC